MQIEPNELHLLMFLCLASTKPLLWNFSAHGVSDCFVLGWIAEETSLFAGGVRAFA